MQSRGHFVGFGVAADEDDQPINGLAEFVADDELLYLDSLGTEGSSISLVRIGPTSIERLDAKHIPLSLKWDFDTPSGYWTNRATTHVVPLSDHRAAVIASGQGIEVFDTASGKIASVGEFALGASTSTIRAATGRGSRFYTCDSAALEAWEVDDASVVRRLGRVVLSSECSSLALSSNAQEMLIAMRNGIDRIDVADPAAMVAKSSFRIGHPFWRVAVEGDFVVAQLRGSWDGTLGIEVYRWSELVLDPQAFPVTRFNAPSGSGPGRWPLGFAFVDGSLAIEWKEKAASSVSYATELHPLGGQALGGRIVHRANVEDRLPTRAFTIAARGRTLVVPPWRSVLRHDVTAKTFVALNGADVSGFRAVVPAAPNHAVALSTLGVHDVDLQNPDAPTVNSVPLPNTASYFRWQPGGAHRLSAPRGIKNDDGSEFGALTLRQNVTPVSCFSLTGGTLAPAGIVSISDEGDAPALGRVIDLGGALLHLNRIWDGQQSKIRLRWYDTPSSCDNRTLVPAIDGLVDISVEHLSYGVGGSAVGAPAVVVIDNRGVDVDTATTVRWMEREPSSSTWRIAATLELLGFLDFFATRVHVHGDLALVHDRRRVVVVERKGATLAMLAQREILDGATPEDLTDVLAFDEELIHVATKRAPNGVVVLRTHDLQPVARFTTHGLVRSMAEIDGEVVFGSANAIDVVDAVCPR